MRTLGVGIALLALLLTACGGGTESPDSERSGSRWVDAVCIDLRRWIDATTTAPDSGSLADASKQLRNDIDALVPPKTDDGNAAQGEVERLAQGIGWDTGHTPTAALVEQVRGSVDGIRNLTPGGVLELAFARAKTCEAVRR